MYHRAVERDVNMTTLLKEIEVTKQLIRSEARRIDLRMEAVPGIALVRLARECALPRISAGGIVYFWLPAVFTSRCVLDTYAISMRYSLPGDRTL